MAAKCKKCEKLLLPPKPMCTNCLSTNLKWIELEGSGKLLTYTIIHIAPEQFQSLTPYPVGIIKLNNGLHLPGMIFDLDHEKIRVGMKLKIDFEPSVSLHWPDWHRYYFRPP
jgi:uncharacterized OB-fold protein